MVVNSDILTRELATLVLTLPWIIYGTYLIWQTKKMRRWRETKGRILSFREKREGVSIQAVAQYSYYAHGAILEGCRITICDWILANGYVAVPKLARVFPAGKEVAVYFDENNPKRCVLRRTGYWLPVLIFASGVIGELVLARWIGGGNTLPPHLRPTIIHI